MASEAIRSRIRKLLELTEANGCTEAEAMAAADKAAKLMRDHGISSSELAFDQEPVPSKRASGAVRARLWSAVGHCTNCSLIIEEDGKNSKVTYVGREPGPQIAGYLHALTDRAIDRELKTFRETTWYRRRRTLKAKRIATAEFTDAMVRRLSWRLLDAFGPTISKQEREAAQIERDRRFPSGKDVAVRPVSSRYVEAQDAGWRSANDVPLHHGVGGSSRNPALLEGTHE